MKKQFLSFSEAKKYVQKLGFRSKNDWVQFSSVGRPNNIPSAPNITYKSEWVSWNDWFGK